MKEIKETIICETFSELKDYSWNHFMHWSTQNSNIIIKNLENYINKIDKEININLNKTPNSMVKLWAWFENNIELITITDKTRKELNKNRVAWVEPYKTNYILSEKTELIARHISIYFGESLKANSNALAFGIIDKEDKGFYKDLYLTGFIGDFGFYLYNEIEELTIKSYSFKNKMRLLQKYNYWKRNIPKEFGYTRLEYFEIEKNLSFVEEKEAKKYFDYFIKMLDKNLFNLEKYIKKSNPEIKLDKTPESLIPIWNFLKNKVEYIVNTYEEARKLDERKSIWMADFTREDICLDSKLLIYDIGIYFGEVLINNNPTLYWDYNTKTKVRSSGFLNREQIAGFNYDFYALWPYFMVENLAKNKANLDDEKALINLYYKWANQVDYEPEK